MNRRLLTDAMVKARVLSREAIEAHLKRMMSQMEMIQAQMMEMQNGKESELLNQQSEQSPIQDTERGDLQPTPPIP
jgi:hypothetical protein